MEYRLLGGSGLKVSVLSLGTGTFGGGSEFFKGFGSSDVKEASRLIDRCLDAGVNLFDSADVYSKGVAEEILGAALGEKRHRALISTKATFRFGEGPNGTGSSRHHLIEAVHGALKRLKTDYIDLFQLHGFDALTPIEEVVDTLDGFVKAGKIRYLGVSNFSGWHLMKSLAIQKERHLTRYVAHQAYYSLVGRDFESELMPLGLDQNVGTVVWSPLGWGRLTGKIRRGSPLPEVSRLQNASTAAGGPQVEEALLFKVIDALDAVAAETGKTVPQIALNWLTTRPGISTVIMGARDEKQLEANLASVGWSLTPAQIESLDAASAVPKTYPYWHQAQFTERNPFPTR